jgi:hypothetical protein
LISLFREMFSRNLVPALDKCDGFSAEARKGLNIYCEERKAGVQTDDELDKDRK